LIISDVQPSNIDPEIDELAWFEEEVGTEYIKLHYS